MENKRFQWKTAGRALGLNMVTGKTWRFTVLTPRLIRMEYDPEGRFEDRASLRFFYRDFPAADFTALVEDGVLTVETESIALTYETDKPFAAGTLCARLKETPYSVWEYGREAEQLKGTARTLDQSNGPVNLSDGVLSRNGYTLIDDSDSMLLTDEGWFDVRPEGKKDVYFFGYGHRYEECVRDFFRITGAPPLLPAYALGNWWSRYHKYTQDEYQTLMERFEAENVPLSVAVVDMDWHLTENIGEENRIPGDTHHLGWTGWTWNEQLFPDYRGFLKFLHKHNLKTSLNLHPAQGVRTHEVMYEKMCIAVGQDPAERKPVKLDILNPAFMEKYFDVILHPYEEEGVDFWWMDWQQGRNYWWVRDEDHPANPLEKMDPLWLLNHLHILDISRNGKRPMFFSRYGGLGSHRYPVGFSGDTQVSWETLDFQPYFTANASNAGYCWWSHDIGGHHHGFREDDLMIRWIEFGIFSPINRLHSTDNPFGGKEPWNLQPYHCEVAKNLLRLRHQLFPYLYAMNYRCTEELVPLVRPMYYAYPETDKAYRCPNQYFFGSEGFVAPITQRTDAASLMGRVDVWFPEGIWIDAFTGSVYHGGKEKKLPVCRPLNQIPVFCKAGAIVPMQDGLKLGDGENMRVMVFPGADNSFTLIEDAGDGIDAPTARTELTFRYGKDSVFTVGAAKGDLTLIPAKRNWTLVFRGFKKGCAFTSDKDIAVRYEEKTRSYYVTAKDIGAAEGFTVSMTAAEEPIFDNADYMDKVFDIILHAQISIDFKKELYPRLQAHRYTHVFDLLGEPGRETLCAAIMEQLELGGEDPYADDKR